MKINQYRGLRASWKAAEGPGIFWLRVFGELDFAEIEASRDYAGFFSARLRRSINRLAPKPSRIIRTHISEMLYRP